MSSTVPHFWSIIRKSCKPFDGLFSKGYMKQIQGIKDKSDEHDVIRLTWDTQQEQKSSTCMFCVCARVCMYACSRVCMYQRVCRQGCSVTWPVNRCYYTSMRPPLIINFSLRNHTKVSVSVYVCVRVCVCVYTPLSPLLSLFPKSIVSTVFHVTYRFLPEPPPQGLPLEDSDLLL